MPKWMAGVDSFTPGKAFGLAVLLAAVNPKNLLLTVGAAAGLAQLGLSTGDAVGSIVVFVIVGSLTIAVPVIYYLVGGEHAKTELDKMKSWLAVHNAAGHDRPLRRLRHRPDRQGPAAADELSRLERARVDQGGSSPSLAHASACCALGSGTA